MTCRKIRTGTV